MSQPAFTKTFLQQLYWRREAGQWRRASSDAEDAPLDDQIHDWVRLSGARIVHPGQLTIHTAYADAEMTKRVTTLGLTVLYTATENPLPTPDYASSRERPRPASAESGAGAGGSPPLQPAADRNDPFRDLLSGRGARFPGGPYRGEASDGGGVEPRR